MPGSSRREKGAKLYGEFDWFMFSSNSTKAIGMVDFQSACRRILSISRNLVPMRQKQKTEKLDWLDSRNTITGMYDDERSNLMRYRFANSCRENSNSHFHSATLHCLVAYATVLIDLSMVSIVAVDLPLPIPNREVKPDNADDTTNVEK